MPYPLFQNMENLVHLEHSVVGDIGMMFVSDLTRKKLTDLTIVAHSDRGTVRRFFHRTVWCRLGHFVRGVLEDEQGECVIHLTDTSEEELDALMGHLYLGHTASVTKSLATALGVTHDIREVRSEKNPDSILLAG